MYSVLGSDRVITFVIPTDNEGKMYTMEYARNDETEKSIYNRVNLITNKLDTYPWSSSDTVREPLFSE